MKRTELQKLGWSLSKDGACGQKDAFCKGVVYQKEGRMLCRRHMMQDIKLMRRLTRKRVRVKKKQRTRVQKEDGRFLVQPGQDVRIYVSKDRFFDICTDEDHPGTLWVSAGPSTWGPISIHPHSSQSMSFQVVVEDADAI